MAPRPALVTPPIIDLPSDTAPGHHYKVCSTTHRNDVCKKLVTELEDPILDAYHDARARMSTIVRESWTDTDAKNIIRIARMWRANELLGRADYVGQLKEVPDLDEFEEQDGRHATARLLAALSPPANPWHAHLDDMQTVLGVEDFLVAQPDNPQWYTFREYNTARSMDFMTNEKDHLRNDISNPGSIFAIARSFNTRFPGFNTHPLAISRGLVNLQLQARHDARGTEPPELSEREEGILLRLLASGLPMVEVIRSLNAEVAEYTGLRAARRWTTVVAKVDEMLEYSTA